MMSTGDHHDDAHFARVIRITVNGREHRRLVDTRLSLADFLRDELDLTGTHLGCEHGVCGACSINLDGAIVRGCLIFAVQCDGQSVMTVEGLAEGENLSVVQQCFWDHHGLQCGFCTPGMLLAAHDLLARNSDPSETEVREHMSGNLCRCTGYQNIVDSVLAAAERMRKSARVQESGR